MSGPLKPPIPVTWATPTVAEVCRVLGGGTPATGQAEYWDGTVPWITSADIGRNGIVSPRRHISRAALEHSAADQVPAGSVIVATRVGLGKVGLATTPLAFSQDCHALVFDRQHLDPQYVALYMAHAAQSYRHVSRGTTIAGITKKQLMDMAQNVRPGRLDLSYRRIVAPPSNDAGTRRSEVRRGDLLVTIVGANTGQVCAVTADVREHYVCQSVALMRPVLPEMSRYLSLYMNCESGGRLQYKRYIYGAGRPHLSFAQLKATPVVVPPLAEQRRIVAEVERRLSVVEQLEAAVEANLRRAARLRQAILKRAFEGKLVPQDPNDEPASLLLERIRRQRAERQNSAPVRQRRRRKDVS
jgi:hypothetical protein